MEATKTPASSRYPDKDDAQAPPGSSAPGTSEYSFPYNSEFSFPHQYTPSYAPSVAPYTAYLPSDSFLYSGPSVTKSNFDPPNLSELSSPSFSVDLQTLQSTPGPPNSYANAAHLPNSAVSHFRRVDSQPPALQHPTGLDEYAGLVIPTPPVHPTTSLHVMQRASVYNPPLPDIPTQSSSGLPGTTLQLPPRQFQPEQDEPQRRVTQRPTTSHLGSRSQVTDSALPRHTFDSQSRSLGIPSAQILSASSSGQTNQGILQGAHNFTMHNVVMNDYSNSETFMLLLLEETIQGVAFDSARRYPPPRCLQGTRQATIDRTWSFINNHNGSKRIRHITGPAGAGKSAVMQTIAEAAFDKAILGASIFFADGGDDVSKAVTTLAYQFAVNYEPYRPFIRGALMHDPSLPRQSLVVQFRKLIVDPFVHQLPRATGSCLLVLLDGLDRCNEDRVCEFLRLITEFTIDHPTSPLTWVISCRAEPRIKMFLDGMKETYEEEVLELDGEEACRDVKYFLQYQLDSIKQTSLILRRCRQWPEERDMTKIAEASKGFFAYADSVAKFVKDENDRRPKCRLSQVLEFINGSPISQVDHLGASHPMSTLDTLYGGIIAKIPIGVKENARRLLLQMLHHADNLHFMCNWLSMTEETAYNATYPLHSVIRIPELEDASSLGLQCFHPSFIDYLRDYQRSLMFSDIQRLTSQLDATCIRSLLSHIINGPLESVGPTHLDIPLSWPEGRDKHVENTSKKEEVRVKILQRAAETTVLRLVEDASEFRDPFYAHALIAFDNDHLEVDPDTFRCLLFEDCRRSGFIKLGVLKEMPLRMLDPAHIDPRWLLTCRFKCRATTRVKKPYNCGPSCPADWKECMEDNYVTRTANFFFNICSCSDRFIRQLEMSKAQFPEQLVTVFLNLKRYGWVEYRFTDPDNYGSEAGFSIDPQAFTKDRHQVYPRPISIDRYDSDWGSKHSIFYLQNVSSKPSSRRKVLKSPTATKKHDLMSLLLKEALYEYLPRSRACHHGTRSATLSRVQRFITDPKRTKRSYWIIGAAGSGKTAIMRTIENNPPNNVTVSISIFLPPAYSNETKIITTIAYQLALRHEPYRQFIKDEIILDPSLLHKSLTTQFHQLIVRPFIHQLLHPSEDGCILILIDGLGQSCNKDCQRTVIALISDFCIRYTASPLVWVISSRPEPYVISILEDIEGAYEKEEIDIDGTEARDDVQHFLRDDLNQITNGSLGTEPSQWPSECDLMKIAAASRGFFAYAASVVKFIKFPGEDPDSRLQQVLEFIDFASVSGDWLDNQPVALSLESLYYPIAINLLRFNAKETSLWLIKMIECPDSLRFICNWLNVTEEAAYNITYALHSVLRVPEPDQAGSRGLECVHPSFIHYIRTIWRRRQGSDIRDSTTQLDRSCIRRILEEAPNGTLKNTPGTVSDIRLSWPGGLDNDSRLVPGDEEIKFRMFKAAAKATVSHMGENDPEFGEPFYVRALTAFENECFEDELHVFSRLLFDESRRSKFMEHGVLKEIPIRTISVTGIDERWPIRCEFRSSASKGPHPCSPSCQVNWVENEEKDQVVWTTANVVFGRCDCSRRFADQLENGKTECSDRLLRVFINLHRTGFVEYPFTEDEGSECQWMYYIPYSFLSTQG